MLATFKAGTKSYEPWNRFFCSASAAGVCSRPLKSLFVSRE